MFRENEHPSNLNVDLSEIAVTLQAVGVRLDLSDAPRSAMLHDRSGLRTYEVHLRDRVSAAVASAIHPRTDRPQLVLAGAVSEGGGDALRALGFDFVDEAGNMRLTGDGLLVDIRGRRGKMRGPRQDTASRAFTRAGAQVVFVLLAWPEMAVEPVRRIATCASVSLGAAQAALDDLAAHKFLYTGRSGRRLVNTGDLLERWSQAYVTGLAPKLRLMTFRAPDPLSWRASAVNLIDTEHVQLGGEIAASELDAHLVPATSTFYVGSLPARLIAANRWVREESDWNVEFRRRFWRAPDGRMERRVPSVLVYADLLATGEPRQREHAKRLRRSDDRLVELERS